MAEIVNFPGVEQAYAVHEQPQADMIALVERFLADVRDGTVQTGAVVGVDTEGAIRMSYHFSEVGTGTVAEIVGALEVLKFRILEESRSTAVEVPDTGPPQPPAETEPGNEP